jgi:hypothetical protein
VDVENEQQKDLRAETCGEERVEKEEVVACTFPLLLAVFPSFLTRRFSGVQDSGGCWVK